MKGSKTFSPYLNSHLLDPKNLRTENDIKLALLNVENELSTTDYGLIFEHFLSKPNLFEFIFSGKFKSCIRLSSHSYASFIALSDSSALYQWLMDTFPKNPQVFVNSVSSRLLSRLSLFFHFLQMDTDQDTINRLARYLRSVDASLSVLKTVLSMSFGVPNISQFDEENICEGNVFMKMRRKGQTQKKKKQAKRATLAPAVDVKAFEVLGVDVPNDHEALAELANMILQEQRAILEVRETGNGYVSHRWLNIPL
jgi:hypothetical protein